MNANTLSVGITLLTQKGLVLMLARLDEKDLQQNLSSLDSTTHVMLVFLKERKVSILFYSIFIIQMLIAQIALYL